MNNPAPSSLTITGNNSDVILFDTNPGTRTWTCNRDGVYRIAVVGAGGGGHSVNKQTRGGDGGGYAELVMSVIYGQQYNYTIGAGGNIGSAGGTTSFSTILSATGGAAGNSAQTPGTGYGGNLRSTGGNGNINGGGGASGSRIGNGGDGYSGGGAWGQSCSYQAGASPQGDGFGLGMTVGTGGSIADGATIYSASGGYGSGGSGGIDRPSDAGTGGGAGASIKVGIPCGNPGIGGGGATHLTVASLSSKGGNGAVIIRIL